MKKAYAILMLLFVVGFTTDVFAQCTSCTLNGPSSIQSGATRTFSTSSASGSNYFWSVTGGLQIIGSNTGTSVSVRAVSGISGRVCIARYGTGRVPCSFCRTISITPSGCNFTSVSVTRLSGNCNTSTLTYRATPNGTNLSGISYSWTALGDNVSIISGQGTNTVTISNPGTTNFIGVRADVTACGITQQGFSADLCQVDDCGGFICELRVAPNPSSSGFNLNVQAGEKALKSRVAQDYTIQILNQYGEVVKEMKTQSAQLYISTEEMSNGMYFVRAIHASGQSKTSTFMVNK